MFSFYLWTNCSFSLITSFFLSTYSSSSFFINYNFSLNYFYIPYCPWTLLPCLSLSSANFFYLYRAFYSCVLTYWNSNSFYNLSFYFAVISCTSNNLQDTYFSTTYFFFYSNPVLSTIYFSCARFLKLCCSYTFCMNKLNSFYLFYNRDSCYIKERLLGKAIDCYYCFSPIFYII